MEQYDANRNKRGEKATGKRKRNVPEKRRKEMEEEDEDEGLPTGVCVPPCTPHGLYRQPGLALLRARRARGRKKLSA